MVSRDQFTTDWVNLQETERALTNLRTQESAWIERAKQWMTLEDARRKKAKLPKLPCLDWAGLFEFMPVGVLGGGLAQEARDLIQALETTTEQKRALQGRLDALADTCEVLPGEPSSLWVLIGWAGSYNSQPNRTAYEKASAEMLADTARSLGLPVEVVRVSKYTEGLSQYYRSAGRESAGQWGAFVQVASPMDLEILKRKSPSTLVEQVRLCWKRGCNPRVFNPYLPHGFEERHGLDYFGGWINKESHNVVV